LLARLLHEHIRRVRTFGSRRRAFVSLAPDH
jgi:hypothetical protein